LSTPEYIPADYSYDCSMKLPVFDQDGDLCQVTVPFDMRAAANSWQANTGLYYYPFRERAYSEEFDQVSMSYLAQEFLNTYLIGWGELSGQIQVEGGGTWLEPESTLA